MIARGLSPVLNTQEQFATLIEKEAALGRDVVRARQFRRLASATPSHVPNC